MLSILFYPWFEIKIIHNFKRTDFNPTPGVDLCLLQITKRPIPLIPNGDLNKYRDFVVFKFIKCSGINELQPSPWLFSYKKDLHCRGYFHKWQNQQSKLEKIRRTRIDKNWIKYRR